MASAFAPAAKCASRGTPTASAEQDESGEACKKDDESMPVTVAVRLNPVASSSSSSNNRCVHPLLPPAKPSHKAQQGQSHFHDLAFTAGGSDQRFRFDHVFSEAASQECIFDELLGPFIPLLFDGYDLSVLAYGESCSGKTYSLVGPSRQHPVQNLATSENEFGLIARVARCIFQRVKALEAPSLNSEDEEELLENDFPASRHPDICIKVSFMTLDNQDIRDLLAENTSSAIMPREVLAVNYIGEMTSRLVFDGLTEIECCSTSEVLTCLENGFAVNRGSCQMSSHTIFMIHIIQSEPQSPTQKLFKKSSIQFVELLGSDRIYVKPPAQEPPSNCNLALNPAQFYPNAVDLGLLSLGNVVSALGDPRRNVSFVPYGDSLLTQSLKNCLGGGSVTLVLCCALVGSKHAEETLNTLMFAGRMSNIRNRPVPNIYLIPTCKEDVDEADDELDELDNELRPPEAEAPYKVWPDTPANMPDVVTQGSRHLDPSQLLQQQDLLMRQLVTNIPPQVLPPAQQFYYTQQAMQMMLLNHYLQVQSAVLPLTKAESPFMPIVSRSTPPSAVSPLSQHPTPASVQMYVQPLTAPHLSDKINPISRPIDLSPEDTEEPKQEKSRSERRRSSLSSNQIKLTRIVEESEDLSLSNPTATDDKKACSDDDDDDEDEDEDDINDERLEDNDSQDFDSECSLVSDIEPQLEPLLDKFRLDSEALIQKAESGFAALPPAEERSELKKQLLELNSLRESKKESVLQSDQVLQQVQVQLEELKESIKVKDSLLCSLKNVDRELRSTNHKFKKRLQMLHEESGQTRRDMREARRLLSMAERSVVCPLKTEQVKRRIAEYKELLETLQANINHTEQGIQLLELESADVDSVTVSLEKMKLRQEQLEQQLTRELGKKAQLEGELEREQSKIAELELQLQKEQEQVEFNLKMSQEIVQQKKWLQSEQHRLEQAHHEALLLSQSLHERQVQLEVRERLLSEQQQQQQAGPEVQDPLPTVQDAAIRRDVAMLRDFKDQLCEERQWLEHLLEHLKPEPQCVHCRPMLAKQKPECERVAASDQDERRAVEIDVYLEALDHVIEYKNDVLSGRAIDYVTNADHQGNFLMQALCQMSAVESRYLLHKLVWRLIDMRVEGLKIDHQQDQLMAQLRDFHRYIQHLNHCLSVNKLEYQRKLDNQKREHLQKLSLLAKSQVHSLQVAAAAAADDSTLESYERKVRQLKEELKRVREHSQLYKRFYRENRHRFPHPPQCDPDAIVPAPPGDGQSRKHSDTASSECSGLDQGRIQRFHRYAQKMVREQSSSKVIRDGKRIIIEQQGHASNGSAAGHELSSKVHKTKRR